MTGQVPVGDVVEPLTPRILEDAIAVIKLEIAAQKRAQEESDAEREYQQPGHTNNGIYALDE